MKPFVCKIGVPCSDPSQHFAGTWRGVDQTRTLSLLQSLAKQADQLQNDCAQGLQGLCTNPDSYEDPRAKSKVLRLLLTPGLMTPKSFALVRTVAQQSIT